MSNDKVHGFVERILGDHRPRRFAASRDQGRQLQAAARLRSARPGADLPRPEFVEQLGEQLRRHLEPERPSHAGRRSFLRGAGLAVAAATAGIGIDRILIHEPETPAGAPATAGEVVPDAGTWVQVATLTTLPAGAVQRFSSNGIEGVLVRTPDGVRALSAVCTHMGCLLTPDAAAGRLRCPCHNAAFDLAGASINGPAYQLRPLPTIRSRVDGDAVQVLVPATPNPVKPGNADATSPPGWGSS